MSTEALKRALEALEENRHLIEEHERPEYLVRYDQIISAVAKALAQSEQELVLWGIRFPDGTFSPYAHWKKEDAERIAAHSYKGTFAAPLYTTPLKRKPLTEWQPIEMAPKGPNILLYSPPLKKFSMRYTNINVAWWVSARITEYWGTAVFFDGRSIVQHVHNPTHWMPLPDVPNAHGIKE